MNKENQINDLEKEKRKTKSLTKCFIVLFIILLILLAALLIIKNNIEKHIPDPPYKTKNTNNVFNATFFKYIGKRKGSEIKQLFIDIKVSNTKEKSANSNISNKKIVTVNNYNENELDEFMNNIKPYNIYKVDINDYDNDGYVKNITITEEE